MLLGGIMADNKETKKGLTPADYDRWGRTCVRFNDDPPKPVQNSPKQTNNHQKRHKKKLTRAEYDDLRQIEWVPFDPDAD